MSAVTTNGKQDATRDATQAQDADREAMLKAHREYVVEALASSGAKQAAISRKLNPLQVRMLLAGLRGISNSADVDSGDADFTFYVEDQGRKLNTASRPEQLVDKIARCAVLVKTPGLPSDVIAASEKMLTDEVANAEKRGVESPGGMTMRTRSRLVERSMLLAQLRIRLAQPRPRGEKR